MERMRELKLPDFFTKVRGRDKKVAGLSLYSLYPSEIMPHYLGFHWYSMKLAKFSK
mgnify:FL=1